MPLTPRKRTLVLQVDALLDRLACDLALGPPAADLQEVRTGFGQAAACMRALGVPKLAKLAAFIDAGLAGLDPATTAAFHHTVSKRWGDWRTRAEVPAGGRDETRPEPWHLARPDETSAPSPLSPEPCLATSRGNEPPPDHEGLLILAADPEIAAMFVAEALDHLGTIEASVLELEASPGDARLLDDVFRPFHTIKGNAGALGLVSVQQFAHTVESLLDLARTGQLRLGPPEFEAVLAAVDVLTTMIAELPARVAGQPGTDTSAVCARVVSRLDRLMAGRDPAPLVSAPAFDTALETADAGATVPVEPPRRKDDAGQGSVKVDTRKLDSLVDMVGELVIAQALIYEDPALKAILDERLQRNLAQVRTITTELQRNAMAMRLVPIKPTFQKMARLVRDLSKRSGKPVELSLAGEDTELDRKVVEEINDPLMHMVRNSIDHGIEPPEARIAAGKRPQGRLSLSASHQGGSIVIAISDDGGGLNTAKILKKAVERGLVAPGETPSPGEIHQLIFKPGFSTADEVTEISGRGVGMDVVRRNIELLRGRIDIQSTLGQGTTFFVKLPLTLAILDGLTLATGGERFVLPIFAVRESLRPTAQQVHAVQGAPRMIQVRDQLMPLLWLADAFGIEGARTDATEATVVVIEDDNRSVGLVVDELVGKQEVVIKSLGETFAGARGVAGGAILGDGRVGLIIDAGGLIDMLGAPPARAA